VARVRTKPAASRPKSGSRSRQGSTSGQYACPECGATFDRPQSLGAHRRQAHGVVGTSKRSMSRQAGSSATSGARQTSGRRREKTSRAATRSRSSQRPRPTDGSEPVDRDRLLQALFPNGIPAREDVIRELNAWLEQAERLARSG